MLYCPVSEPYEQYLIEVSSDLKSFDVKPFVLDNLYETYVRIYLIVSGRVVCLWISKPLDSSTQDRVQSNFSLLLNPILHLDGFNMGVN